MRVLKKERKSSFVLACLGMNMAPSLVLKPVKTGMRRCLPWRQEVMGRSGIRTGVASLLLLLMACCWS